MADQDLSPVDLVLPEQIDVGIVQPLRARLMRIGPQRHRC